MGIVLSFLKAKEKPQGEIFPAPEHSGEPLPQIGYHEFKDLMRVKAITFFYDDRDFSVTWAIPRDRESDMNKRLPGEDRVQWHLAVDDYIYWYLTHQPGCGRVQLSKEADGNDYLIRYDAESFEPVMEEARKSLIRARLTLPTTNPSSTEAAPQP